MTGYEGPAVSVLLTKLVAQGWTNLFLQGDVQRKFEKSEVYEFYTDRIECGE